MRVTTLLVATLLAGLGTEVRANVIPPLAQTHDIEIGSLACWFLTIKPDGSGHFGFGQGGGDFGNIPKGTFQFAAVYEELAGEARVKGNSHRELWVDFQPAHSETGASLFWNNRKEAEKLMSLAFSTAEFIDRKREIEILKTHPFLPDPNSLP